MQVELVYDEECPNVPAARAQLMQAFAAAGVAPRWQEWALNAGEAPARVRGYGSPTILVNGADVAGAAPHGDAAACRVYGRGSDVYQGVPPLDDILRALRSASQPETFRRAKGAWRLNGAILPAFGTALLPKLACPACWPAYGGLLSSLGVGFVDYTPYLLPLTIGFLALALAALGYRASRRRGYGPLVLGLIASAVILVGKFGYDHDIAMYTGLTALVAASLWNTWPRRQPHSAPCPACTTPERNTT